MLVMYAREPSFAANLNAEHGGDGSPIGESRSEFVNHTEGRSPVVGGLLETIGTSVANSKGVG